MSSTNPTALRIGMQGPLEGRRHIVLGRVVLGMQADDGETYYWNEFYVADDSGRVLTLVFEETEDGPTWKIFKMFEPSQPMSAREAAAKSVGDTVSFDGKPIHVTLVDQTRVYHIEGDAPEGVALGDVADYFNADADDRVLVASWTGDEIEFYEGRDLPAGTVEQAFSLPQNSSDLTAGLAAGGAGTGEVNRNIMIAAVVLVAVVAVSVFSCSRERRSSNRPPEPPPRQAAPAVRLAVGTNGAMAGHTYVIAGHALIGIARQGGKFDRHEYDLVDETGGHLLLVNALGGNPREWHLFSSAQPPDGFTAYEAAALRQGKLATIAGRPMQVTQLFQYRVLASDGRPAASVWPASLQYGLIARVKEDWLISRWDEAALLLYGGKVLPEREVVAAFGPGG